MIVEVIQEVACLKDGDSASAVLKDSSFSLDFILDADVVVIIHRLALAALPHAVMRLHLHVEFRVAVHDAALLNEAFEGADFHGQTEGFVGEVGQTAASDLCFCWQDFLLCFFRLGFLCFTDEGEGVQRLFGA